jgi:hypothetical protein
MKPSASCRRWPGLGPYQAPVDNNRLAGGYRLGVAEPWDAGDDAGGMTMRQMQSVDRADRLTAILIMINAAALVLLAFVL